MSINSDTILRISLIQYAVVILSHKLQIQIAISWTVNYKLETKPLKQYIYKATAIFDKAHSKMIESTFNFPEFVTACKKSVYSICSVLRYSQF